MMTLFGENLSDGLDRVGSGRAPEPKGVAMNITTTILIFYYRTKIIDVICPVLLRAGFGIVYRVALFSFSQRPSIFV